MMAGHYSRCWLVLAAGCCLLLQAVDSAIAAAATAKDQNSEEKTSFEAAFQGRCGHGSPCEQLCYELHDGMYECDCRDGYILHKNGYSCAELNSTSASTSVGNILESDHSIADSLSSSSSNLIEPNSAEEDNVEDILYMRGASFTIHLDTPRANLSSNDSHIVSYDEDETNEIPDEDQLLSTPQNSNPTDRQQQQQQTTISTESILNIEPACTLDCGPGGSCYLEQESILNDISVEPNNNDNQDEQQRRKRQSNMETTIQRCQCPLGRGGDRCEHETEVRSPRFTGLSWLAFPALHAAYKHVQLELEFRPEAWDGVLLLAGERDDLQGDFMALILHHGYVEFRFDCGSGVGIVRSSETVKLNEWNVLNIYRHRWDAWLQLNQEKRVQGRSKGLFSRITFREPLFVGGPGNTSGLERLPVRTGFRGCVRNLEVNEHRYHFPLTPLGDALNGFDVEKCTADRCSKVPCSHGGKCLTTGGDTAVCLCPLGYTGDLCETRVDLQVPSFNGSSYLRYAGLAETSLSWLELSVTLKPTAPDGVILYNGHHSDATGDFIALYLAQGHVQFTFDLGTGCATLRSERQIQVDEWIEIRVSRTGRLASLEVENDPPQEIMAPGAFTQLSLPLNLYLGGAPSTEMYSPKMKIKSSFVGCIQQVVLNRREIGILAEALGGVNVGNCGHACEARPCGDAECRPLRDRFTCRCRPGLPHPCPAPDEQLQEHQHQQQHQQQHHQQQQQQHIEHIGMSSIEPTLTRYATSVTSSSLTQPEMPVPSFTGTDSYLHYDDADTMKRIISYKVDINMRFRLILTSGQYGDIRLMDLTTNTSRLLENSHFEDEEFFCGGFRFCVHQNLPYTVLAGSQKGKIVNIDVRADKPTQLFIAKHDNSTIYEICGIDINPAKCSEFCIGGFKDIRIYDHRNLSSPVQRFYTKEGTVTDCFHNDNRHILAVKYNYDGSEILAAYSEIKPVYLFNTLKPYPIKTYTTAKQLGDQYSFTVYNVHFVGSKSEFIIASSSTHSNFAGCTHSNNIYMWDKDSEDMIHEIQLEERSWRFAAHPHMPILAMNMDHKGIRMWQ